MLHNLECSLGQHGIVRDTKFLFVGVLAAGFLLPACNHCLHTRCTIFEFVSFFTFGVALY